jgi:hypothetical protein
MSIARILLLMPISILMLSCVTTEQQQIEPSRPITEKKALIEPYRIIFCTGIDEEHLPINDLESISLIEDNHVYIYVKWSISVGTYSYLCKVHDGAGKEVFRGKMEFSPTDPDWNTWSWFTLNPYIDSPGLWRFEIYIDGKKYIDEEFPITY